ncbi:hypothetical protein [Xanthomonas sp. 3058]|uniref:hypothetical protein n=1 Tax=Xanthomonas sp. 3058 TaxID=3035314 RepID=UPI00161632CF|nr:hypothetical protein [Xanthomonas sp. 3058]MBB5863191.1 hypothetical protein [Xanthomonas sp. 3058]
MNPRYFLERRAKGENLHLLTAKRFGDNGYGWDQVEAVAEDFSYFVASLKTELFVANSRLH